MVCALSNYYFVLMLMPHVVLMVVVKMAIIKKDYHIYICFSLSLSYNQQDVLYNILMQIHQTFLQDSLDLKSVVMHVFRENQNVNPYSYKFRYFFDISQLLYLMNYFHQLNETCCDSYRERYPISILLHIAVQSQTRIKTLVYLQPSIIKAMIYFFGANATTILS